MPLATPTITVIDPATERELASSAEHGPDEIEALGLREFTNLRTYRVAA